MTEHALDRGVSVVVASMGHAISLKLKGKLVTWCDVALRSNVEEKCPVRSVRIAHPITECWMPDQTRRQRAVSFIIKSRTARSKFFPSNLFSEPAWDMLLKLYAAAIEQRELSISALAKTVNVEPSTAARWVNALEKEKLVTRQIVKGIEMVSLSERGWFAMDSYFENMSSGMI